jgi:hypothetical protein
MDKLTEPLQIRFRGSWDWTRNDPTGATYPTITYSDSIQSVYQHNSDSVHNNGRIIASLIRRIADEGDSYASGYFRAFTQSLHRNKSAISDGIENPAYTNFIDLAATYSAFLENGLGSPVDDRLCAAWHGTGVKIDGFPTSPCDPHTPWNISPAVNTHICVRNSQDNYATWWTKWLVAYDPIPLGKGSFTEWYARANSSASWVLKGVFDPSYTSMHWTYSNSSSSQIGQIRMRTCVWDLVNYGKRCDSYSDYWNVNDTCPG